MNRWGEDESVKQVETDDLDKATAPVDISDEEEACVAIVDDNITSKTLM